MIRNLIVLPDGSELFSGASGAAIMDCTLTRTVNNSQELTIGSVCSAMLEFTLIHPSQTTLAAGQEVTLYHVAEDDTRQQAGIFRLEKPVYLGAEKCRVTAYDRISYLDKDLTAWLKNRKDSCSLKEFATQVCQACGLALAKGEIPNAELSVPVFTATDVTGRDLMQWVGEAAGCFCAANSQGQPAFGWYAESDLTLAPAAAQSARVWEEGGNVTIQSQSVKTIDDNKGKVTLTSQVLSMTEEGDGAVLAGLEQAARIPWFQGTLELGDYTVAPVESVQISKDGLDDTNAYILSGNPILNETALQTIQSNLTLVGGYTPCRVSIPAGFVRPGDIITLTDTKGIAHRLPVMTVTRSGQRDTIECTGSARRDSSEVRNNRTAEQIAQQKVDAMTQADIFNKLTDNGKVQGFYLEDDKLYINAEFVKIVNLVAGAITSGLLSSADGNTCFDLDSGHIVCKGDNQSTFITDGHIALQNSQDQSKRLFIDDTGLVFFDGGGVTGLQLYCNDGQLKLGCYDQDAQRNVTRQLSWKTVNGEKILVGI